MSSGELLVRAIHHQQPRTLTPGEEMRILAGIAIQPCLALVVAFVGFRVLGLDPSGATIGGLSDATQAAVSVAVGTAVVAVVIALVFALPTAVWLTRRHRVSWAVAVLFGLLFGNLPFLAGAVLIGTYGLDGFLRGMALSSLLGSTGASAFWVIALRRSGPLRDRTAGARRQA